MKYDSNELQALGECLRVCSTYDLEPRRIARMMLELLTDDAAKSWPELDDELDLPAVKVSPAGGRHGQGQEAEGEGDQGKAEVDDAGLAGPRGRAAGRQGSGVGRLRGGHIGQGVEVV